jgi:hypothetical protein
LERATRKNFKRNMNEQTNHPKVIVLISCVSKKRKVSCPAEELYMGPLFKNSLCVARKLNPDHIYIISAKHHLLDLKTIIKPYDETLKNFSLCAKNEWGRKTAEQLSKVSNLQTDKFIILAGKDYIEPLLSHITYIDDFLNDRIYGKRTSYLKSICSGE